MLALRRSRSAEEIKGDSAVEGSPVAVGAGGVFLSCPILFQPALFNLVSLAWQRAPKATRWRPAPSQPGPLRPSVRRNLSLPLRWMQSFGEDLAARGFSARAPPRGRSRPRSRSPDNRVACPSHSVRLRKHKSCLGQELLASGIIDLSETCLLSAS